MFCSDIFIVWKTFSSSCYSTEGGAKNQRSEKRKPGHEKEQEVMTTADCTDFNSLIMTYMIMYHGIHLVQNKYFLIFKYNFLMVFLYFLLELDFDCSTITCNGVIFVYTYFT